MKNPIDILELQAYADGELAPERRAELEQHLAGDPGARANVDALKSVQQLLRSHESPHRVGDSREFYWSQIQRRIDQVEQATGREESKANPAEEETHGGGLWLRWLLSLGAAAALAATFMVSRDNSNPRPDSFAMETGSEDSGAVTFGSDSDAVTICWID